jgi:hypothetical protein
LSQLEVAQESLLEGPAFGFRVRSRFQDCTDTKLIVSLASKFNVPCFSPAGTPCLASHHGHVQSWRVIAARKANCEGCFLFK